LERVAADTDDKVVRLVAIARVATERRRRAGRMCIIARIFQPMHDSGSFQATNLRRRITRRRVHAKCARVDNLEKSV